MRDNPTANHLERRRWIAEAEADYAVFVVTASGIDEAMSRGQGGVYDLIGATSRP